MGVTRNGVEATITVSVCVWIVGLIARNRAVRCGATTGAVVCGACGLRRRLWIGTTTAVAFLAPKGLGFPLLKLNGLANPLLRATGASTDTACESSTDARIDVAESRTEGTDCSIVQLTLHGIFCGSWAGDGGE